MELTPTLIVVTLFASLPKTIHNTTVAYLIVQVKMIKFTVGAEVLRVAIQGKVDIPSVTLNNYRVPMVIIQ